MKFFESIRPKSPKIERTESLAEQQEKMVLNEKNYLTKRFKNVSGKAKALLGVFLLSTALNYGSAQAFEKNDQNFNTEEETHLTATKNEMDAENIVKLSKHLVVLNQGKEFTWGVEYVPKQEDNKTIFSQRYVKIENKTGKATILGEYDSVTRAAEEISKIPDLPEEIRHRAQQDADAVQMERNYQASGLVEPTGKVGGKTHIEERNFEGYGIKTKTKVEVDEAGNVVRLLEHSEPKTGGPDKTIEETESQR